MASVPADGLPGLVPECGIEPLGRTADREALGDQWARVEPDRTEVIDHRWCRRLGSENDQRRDLRVALRAPGHYGPQRLIAERTAASAFTRPLPVARSRPGPARSRW